jgi:hypothetical protein
MWARPLSCRELTFSDGDTVAANVWDDSDSDDDSDDDRLTAAVVAVGRGGGAEGFALAVLVEAMPAPGG